jgi:hypothetical protein
MHRAASVEEIMCLQEAGKMLSEEGGLRARCTGADAAMLYCLVT